MAYLIGGGGTSLPESTTGVFDKNEIYPYITEGIGEDILPKNVNFDIIDGFVKVTEQMKVMQLSNYLTVILLC